MDHLPEPDRDTLLRLLDALPLGVVLTDAEERILYANAPYCAAVDLPLSALLGRVAGELAQLSLTPADREQLRLTMRGGEVSRHLVRARLPGGGEGWHSVAIQPLPGVGGSQTFVGTLVDVNGWVLDQRRWHAAAHTDPLTGAENRRAYEAALLDLGGEATLLVIDLNGLKALNDTRGHGVGDALLRAFTAGAQAACRRQDRVFRTGGDEFALLFAERLPEPLLRQRSQAMLDHLIAHGFPEASFAYGAAYAPTETTEPGQLQTLADARMYAMKRGARAN